MREIIEDTISRNRDFQESRRLKAKIYKDIGAPDELVEYEEMISKMTIAEYEIHCKQLEQEEKQINSEYAKNNPIQQSIVDEIYRRESELEYDSILFSSNFRLINAINPLDFMSAEDYRNDIYKAFLDHAREIYRERYKEQQ